ncbi:MAG: putative extracellular substrate-binding protein [Bacillales bacterium]|jgi:putative ABC transport system substrate-binding protein|nr:putative extracellular substrate-binding protein [Bacillales bacterium]
MVGRKSALLVASVLALSIFSGCSNSEKAETTSTSKEEKVVKIGISQLMEHPALDASRKGFIDGLKEAGFEEGKNIKIDFQNAQGDQPTTQTIAQKFVNDKVDMILAIATPPAQAAFNATKDIPILITAVADPVKAGVAKSLESSETNVTGTTNSTPITNRLDLIKKLVPNAKKVGILYSTSEINAQVQVDAATKAAPDFGFEIVTAGVTNANEIPQAMNSLVGKIDALFVPTDNLVVSSMPIIADICLKKKIPIIGSDKGISDKGALAITGVDYYKLGKQTAEIAVEIINGKKPQDIEIGISKDLQLIVNTDVAKELNITIPKEIDEKAEKVTGGVR